MSQNTTQPPVPQNTTARAGYVALASAKFAQLGYHGTSLSAVARDAKVTKQALLHFFGTKEKLYADVLTDLATRHCDALNAARTEEPSAHLARYFKNFLERTLAQPDDIRLVIRALLDADDMARTWPMKPYLDALLELCRRTPGGQDQPKAVLLAWLTQWIGTIQYLALSAPAVTGMYGSDMAQQVQDRLSTDLAQVIDRHLGGQT